MCLFLYFNLILCYNKAYILISVLNMRINLCSDLHLEFGDLTLPGGDVLILSGDIVEVNNFDRPKSVAARFFHEECEKYEHVIYVAGNHEHYNHRYDQTHNDLRALLPDNVTLLEQQSHTIGDVTFLGGTLWTDMNRGDPSTKLVLRRGMNDFHYITRPDPVTGSIVPITPDFIEQVHANTLAFFKSELEMQPSNKFVVVTHHAPSRQSIAERYKSDYLMNGGYASELSDFILDHPQIHAWTHGHTHTFFDYMVGGTRVLCNPRGYIGYERRSVEFDPAFSFEV